MLHCRSKTLQFLLLFIAMATAESCDYYKYNTTAGCVRCPDCPIGQEATVHCGNNGRSGPKCKPCSKEYFSAKPSVECEHCQFCGGKFVLKECTLTSDRVCVDQCPDGYTVSNGACFKKPTTMATTETTASTLPISSQWVGAKLSFSLPTSISLSTFSKHGKVSSSSKHAKTEPFVTPTVPLTVNDWKKEKDLLIVIAIVPTLILGGIIIIIYCYKKRKQTCQSQVRKSHFSAKKDETERAEEHVVDIFPPKESHLVGATPIETKHSTPNPEVEGGSAYVSNTSAKSIVSDSGKEPEDLKKSAKDNDPLTSYQSEDTKTTAVQHFEFSELQQNEKLVNAKKGLNKLLDNRILNQQLNLPREESEIERRSEPMLQNHLHKEKERRGSRICERHSKNHALDQHSKVETSTKEPFSFISPLNGTAQKKCPYRPINRRIHSHGEDCLECCPQDSDLLSIIIGRYCLKEEVCNMLNVTSNDSWKKLLTVMRQDKMIAQLQNSREQNPAMVVIDKLVASIPTLTFGTFKSMMNEIERPDIAHIMQHHHFKCDTCRRNIFDEPKLCVCQLT